MKLEKKRKEFEEQERREESKFKERERSEKREGQKVIENQEGKKSDFEEKNKECELGYKKEGCRDLFSNEALNFVLVFKGMCLVAEPLMMLCLVLLSFFCRNVMTCFHTKMHQRVYLL